MLPPAIAIFSSLLKNAGYECELFDTTYWDIPEEDLIDAEEFKEKHLHVRPYEPPPIDVTLKTTDVYEEFIKKVETFNPQLIAVSSTEDMFPFAIRILEKLPAKNRPIVIIGGMLATFAPELVIKYDEIDIVCVGEGELALLELCDKLNRGGTYTDINNLWVKYKGSLTKNPIGKTFEINDVPLPDIDLFEEARFYKPFDGKSYRTFPVETHRGCPYKCAYCNSPTQLTMYKDIGDKFFRLKNIEGVRRELLHYKDRYDAEYIYFWADTFLAWSDSYFEEFVDMYKSDVGLPFWCQTRPETLNEKNVSMLKDMGIHRMGLGIEHGNEEFRRKMLARTVKNKHIIERLKILNDYDVKYSVNNIIGFPNETRELAMDTIRLNREINADTRNMYTFTPFFGTPLRKQAVDSGLMEPDALSRSLTAPTVLDMPQFSTEEIEGVRRCFVPYVLLEYDRWDEIRAAEKFTDEGNLLWESLMSECSDRFFS